MMFTLLLTYIICGVIFAYFFQGITNKKHELLLAGLFWWIIIVTLFVLIVIHKTKERLNE